MTRILFALLVLLLPALAAAQDKPWPTREWLTTSPEEQGISSEALAKLIEFGAANAMDSLMVIRNGRIVLDTTYAPFRTGLKHRMYSTTKAVMSTLISIALMEGKLQSLDQRLVDFFPGESIANLDDQKKAITVRHLLHMTSGLQWAEPFNGLPSSFFAMEQSSDWRKFILDNPMVATPGSRFNYSSGSSHLLSAILTKVTGQSAHDYAHDKLFKPLGIEDVLWRADPQGLSTGGTGLYLQPRDMAKLGYLWLRNGQWDGRQIVPASLIDSVRKADVDLREGWSANLRYGSQFWTIPRKDVFMAVGYHRQLIIVMPKLDLVAVATGSTRHNGTGVPITPRYNFETLVERVEAAVKSDKALPANAAAAALLAEAVKTASVETPTQAGGSSEMAKFVSGKVYHFQDNALRVKSLRFDLAGGEPSYEYDTASFAGTFGGPIGFDGLYKVGGRMPSGLSAAKGTWLDRYTLVVELLTLGNDDAARATHVFGDKTVDLTYEGANGFRVKVQGRTDD